MHGDRVQPIRDYAAKCGSQGSKLGRNGGRAKESLRTHANDSRFAQLGSASSLQCHYGDIKAAIILIT